MYLAETDILRKRDYLLLTKEWQSVYQSWLLTLDVLELSNQREWAAPAGASFLPWPQCDQILLPNKDTIQGVMELSSLKALAPTLSWLSDEHSLKFVHLTCTCYNADYDRLLTATKLHWTKQKRKFHIVPPRCNIQRKLKNFSKILKDVKETIQKTTFATFGNND